MPSHVLIVDDEELNSEGLSRRLQRLGYSVSVARSGRAAIEQLYRKVFAALKPLLCAPRSTAAVTIEPRR